MTEAEKQDRTERRRRHPVWNSRRAGGMTLACFSHWSDEEPPAGFSYPRRQTQEQTDPDGGESGK